MRDACSGKTQKIIEKKKLKALRWRNGTRTGGGSGGGVPEGVNKG